MINILSLKEFISTNNIIYLSIRFINNEGVWSNITFPTKIFNLASLKDFSFKNIELKNISNQRAFIDPFLSHKTLVLLADVKNAKYTDATYATKLDYLECVFNIGNKNFHSNANYILPDFACPDDDNSADLKAEISQALLDMGVIVLSFYTKFAKFAERYNGPVISNVINILKTRDNIGNIDNLAKAKYAITMICSIYKIPLLKNEDSIFTAYKLI